MLSVLSILFVFSILFHTKFPIWVVLDLEFGPLFLLVKYSMDVLSLIRYRWIVILDGMGCLSS